MFFVFQAFFAEQNCPKTAFFSKFFLYFFQKIFFLEFRIFLKFFLKTTEVYIYPVQKIWDKLLHRIMGKFSILSSWGSKMTLFEAPRGPKLQKKVNRQTIFQKNYHQKNCTILGYLLKKNLGCTTISYWAKLVYFLLFFISPHGSI